MSLSRQLDERLNAVLNCARRIAELSVSILNGQDHLDELRRLGRDLPHLIAKAIAAFHGYEHLAPDLQHELKCIREDTLGMLNWVKEAADDLQGLHAVTRTADDSGAASVRYGQARQAAFVKCESCRQAVFESCNRAFSVACGAYAAADRLDQERAKQADPAAANRDQERSRKARTMPLSRLDLPRIVEAIRELHHIIADPPAESWQAPAWLIEQYKQTTLGEAGVPKKPSHAWLIHAAAVEVLNRLMPPWHHTKPDCPEITESLLDMRHKVKLIELRDLLSSFALGERLADNRSKALQFLAFLESVLEQLNEASPAKAASAPRDQGGAGQEKGAGASDAPTPRLPEVPGRPNEGTIHNPINCALDALLSWAQEHDDKPFGRASEEELSQLDADLYAMCQRASVVIPRCPVSSNFRPFGFSGIPHHRSNQGMTVHLTAEWKQAMRGLRATVQAGMTGERAGDQGEVGEAEEGGEVNVPAGVADDETSGEKLADRQCSILETMLEYEIASERRRKSRADIVRLINRTHKSETYGRDFADLVKRGYLCSLEGSRGGYWLTPTGKAEAQRLRPSN